MQSSKSTQPLHERFAKHSLPNLAPGLLRRQRLLDFLHEHIDRKLLLVSAAAGYGKTALLLDFAHDTDLPVAWLSLNEADRDLAVFLADVLAALRGPFPDFGESTSALLGRAAVQAPQAATVLAREIESSIEDYFILCLDDYHLIEESEAVALFMERLLEQLPEHAHLLIAGRTLPPLPITPLAARQQIAGLSEEQLRFVPAEVQALLRLRNEVALPEAEAEQLVAHSEGWITGILLSSHLMWKGLVANWIRARQADTPVYDYLADEVLAGQPEPLRQFLMESAVLPEMDSETCDAVLGRTDSEALLRQAESQRLFVTGVGDGPRTLGYHHLFREFLLSRLRATQPERLGQLQRRAGEWYESLGWPETALTYYLAAGEKRRAIGIVEANAEPLFYGGRHDTLRRWGEQVAGWTLDTPGLHLALSKVHTDGGDLNSAGAALEVAEAGYAERQDEKGQTSVAIQRSLLAYRRGEYQQALSLASEAAQRARANGHGLQAAAAERYIGLSRFALGDLAAAQESLARAADLFQRNGRAYDRAWALHDLAHVLRAAGQTARAALNQQEALSIWREGKHLGPLAMALNNVGLDQHMLGQYEAALATYAEAMDRARQSGSGPVEALILAGRGDLLAELGQLEPAADLYQRAMAQAESMRDKGTLNYTYRAQARLERWRGNHVGALEWLRRAQLTSAPSSATSPGTEADCLRGAILVDMGRLDEAIALLERTCAELEKASALVDLALGLLCLAQARFRCGAQAEAWAALGRAFELAEQVGFDQMLVAEALSARDVLLTAQSVPGLAPRAASLISRAEAARRMSSHLREPSLSVAEPRAPAFEIRALGGSRVFRQGVELTRGDWVSQQSRELFLYLVDRAPARRDDLLSTFWPEMRAARATDNFHQTLSRLRRAVGPEVVVFVEGEYRFAPGLDLDYDVARFERRAREALALGTGDLRRLPALAAAIELYTGDYLADLPVDWASDRRQALSDLFVASLSAHAAELMHLARYAEARRTLDRALAVDPLHDALHLGMLRCLAAMGRRDEVVKHYRFYRETLRSELGLEPPAEARSLYAQLIH